MFIDFLKKPSTLYFESDKTISIWKDCFNMILIVIMFTFLLGVAYTLITAIVNMSFEDLYPDNFDHNLKSFKKSVPFPALWIIVLGPIYEEISFRLGLSFKKGHFIISVLLILFFLTGGDLIYSAPAIHYILETAIRLSILLILFFISNKYITQNHIDYLKDHHSDLIVYLFASIFAILHVTNYFPFELRDSLFYLVIMALIFIRAMALSYLRVKYGLLCAMLFHMVINFISYSGPL